MGSDGLCIILQDKKDIPKVIVRGEKTEYAGVVFRSKLEAKWAAYLDHMNCDWEYEPVRFGAICTYTPDFGIRGRRIFVEIKCKEQAKYDGRTTGRFPLIRLGGPPDAYTAALVWHIKDKFICERHRTFWDAYLGACAFMPDFAASSDRSRVECGDLPIHVKRNAAGQTFLRWARQQAHRQDIVGRIGRDFCKPAVGRPVYAQRGEYEALDAAWAEWEASCEPVSPW